MTKYKYFTPSVDNAAKILIYLSRYKSKQSTLTDISNNLNINKSTCLRVLKTLELNNLIYYNEESKKYSLGIYISVLGHRVEENLNYLKVIKEYLDEASEKTGLTAALLQRVQHDRVMFVAQSQTQLDPKLTISVGNRFPLTEVSYGKWILASVLEEERDYYLKDGLKQVTVKTITDLPHYLKQLEEIKDTNILVSREEYTKDVIAISSALYDWKGQVIAIIALVGVSKLVDKKQEKRLGEMLKEITYRCNQQLLKMGVEATKFEFKIIDEDNESADIS